MSLDRPVGELDFCGEFQLPFPDSENLFFDDFELPLFADDDASESSRIKSASRFLFSTMESLRSAKSSSGSVLSIFNEIFLRQA